MPARVASGRLLPGGYLGLSHEALGSDLLAVEDALRALSVRATTVRNVLGEVSASRLAQVRADDWYPIEWLLDILDAVDGNMGRFGLLKMGRMAFKRSHAARATRIGGKVKRGRDVVLGLDAMYRRTNRGEGIGGWSVHTLDDDHALVELRTPRHCAHEEGVVSEALQEVGCAAVISQVRCLREGSDACLFEIRPLARRGIW